MKRNLTTEEQNLFSDIQKFNQENRKNFKLHDRTVKAMDWSTIELRGAVLKNLELRNLKMAQSQISDSQFIRIQSYELDLSGASFANVRFEDCVFDQAKFDRSRFYKCTFKNCQISDSSGQYTYFQQCRFYNCVDKRSNFEDANLINNRFEKSFLERTGFSRTRISKTAFIDSNLDRVMIGMADVNTLTFNGTKLVNCGFNGGRYRDFFFSESTINSVSMSALTISNFKLTGCRNVELMSFLRTEVHGCVVDNCKKVIEWSAFESKISQLHIINSHLKYLVWEICRINGPSLIEQTVFEGANFSETKWDDAEFRKCTFDDFMVLTDASFNRVRLSSPRFETRLEIDDEGVQYEKSDRFIRGSK